MARIEVVVETQQGIIDTLVGLTRKYQTQIADLSAALAEQRHTKSQGETNPEQAGAE